MERRAGAKRGQPLRQIRIQLQRLEGRRLHGGRHRVRREEAEVPQRAVRFGDGCMRQREARLDRHGLVVVVERTEQFVSRPAVPEVAASKIGVVRVGSERLDLIESRGLLRRQRDLNPPGDRARDVGLEHDDVAQIESAVAH